MIREHYGTVERAFAFGGSVESLLKIGKREFSIDLRAFSKLEIENLTINTNPSSFWGLLLS